MYDPLTKKCILNDWDLAYLVAAGQLPSRQGYRRTGTIPFMAMELLTAEAWNGEIKIRYRHELESFAWALLWICGNFEDCKERRQKPFNGWITDYNTCREKKADYLGLKLVIYSEWEPYRPFLLPLRAQWRTLRDEAADGEVLKEVRNVEHLRKMYDAAKPPAPNIHVKFPWIFVDKHLVAGDVDADAAA
jgi:hypothetical protein